MLRGADQLQYLQHLLYLLPPCNCDTLLRLLTLLHTVQSFAQDSIGTNDEEVGPVTDKVQPLEALVVVASRSKPHKHKIKAFALRAVSILQAHKCNIIS